MHIITTSWLASYRNCVYKEKEILNGLRGKWTSCCSLSDSTQPIIETDRKCASDLELKVSDLLDFERGGWDENLVRDTFIEEEWTAVLSIPIARNLPQDRWYWWPTKDGFYSAKRGSFFDRGKEGVARILYKSCVWASHRSQYDVQTPIET